MPHAKHVVKSMWRDRRLLDLFGIEHPIVQAPMAGAQGSALAIAVCEAGGSGVIAVVRCFSVEQARTEMQVIRQRTDDRST